MADDGEIHAALPAWAAPPPPTEDDSRSLRERVEKWAENPTAIIAILTGLGFVMGGMVVAAFAAGLGVAVTDFGLDLRATVTLAAGLIFYPALYFALMAITAKAWVSVSRGWVVAIVFFGILVSGLALLWWSGLVVGFGLVFVLFGSVGGAVGAASGDSDEKFWNGPRDVLAVFAGVALVSGGTVLLGAYLSGSAISDDADVRVPKVVSFVLPVTRGKMAVGERSVCVDRVGDHVMVGDASTAVLPDWDSFVIEDCQRGDVSVLLSPITRGMLTIGDESACIDRLGSDKVLLADGSTRRLPDDHGFMAEDCVLSDESVLFDE